MMAGIKPAVRSYCQEVELDRCRRIFSSDEEPDALLAAAIVLRHDQNRRTSARLSIHGGRDAFWTNPLQGIFIDIQAHAENEMLGLKSRGGNRQWSLILLAVVVTWLGLLTSSGVVLAADVSPRLSATLLPAVGDAQGSQLAVNWNGAAGAHLEVVLAQAAQNESMLVADRVLNAGVNLLSLAVDSGMQGTLRLRVSDGAGKTKQTWSQNLEDLRGASGFAWESRFFGPGLDNAVAAVVVWDDGSGPALYVGGQFVIAGAHQVNYVARWDGDTWAPLSGPSGTGVLSGGTASVSTLAVYDGALIVGGGFSTAGGVTANNIARWDGHQWSAMGEPANPGVNATVSTLVVHDGALIAGGSFTSAGSTTVNRIARWNGTAWSALTGPSGTGVDNSVLALTVFDGALVAGGNFTSAGGVTANRVARWDGSTWSSMSGASGNGVNSQVRALAVFDGALIVGGAFTAAGGNSANRIARWNGNEWSALGTGMSGGQTPTVIALMTYDGALVAGGAFLQAGGTTVNNIASWNGSTWSSLPAPGSDGLSGGVAALSQFRGSLVVAGTFTQAGGQPSPVGGGINVNGIARWNGSTWSALEDRPGTGLTGQVSALAVFDGALIAGGSFTRAGRVDAWGIARWDGVAWSPLSGSLGAGVMTLPLDFVSSLVVHDGALIVGGQFARAGGVVANGIARWDGREWSSLAGPSGTGLSTGGAAFALTVHDGALIVAGSFTTVSGVPANNIARWDGHAWSALGAGTNQTITALAIYGGALIVGGGFTQAGDVTVNRVGRWNGSAWSGLAGPSGVGVSGDVRALTVFNGALIAAGGFTTAGGVSANRIARWDGSAWSPLGSGLNSNAYSLGVYRGALIAGGNFAQAGGVVVNGIARWDGSAWSALAGPSGAGTGPGSGTTVFALLPFDVDGAGPVPEKLVAGGWFLTTGGVTNWRLGLYGPIDPLSNLSVTPAALDFGALRVGAAGDSRTLTLSSSGNQTVAITSISAGAAPFARDGGTCPATPFDLAPGAACTLAYRFTPTAAGDFTQTVTIGNSGAVTGFTLAGRGLPASPAIAVEPGALSVDLGANGSAVRALSIANRGGSDLVWNMADGLRRMGGVQRPLREATLFDTAVDLAGIDRSRLLGTHPGTSLSAPAVFGTESAGERITLTHSASMDIVAGNSAGCSSGSTGFTSENRYLRAFTLADFGIGEDFQITEVTFGIQSMTPAQNITVNLYTLSGEFVYANMHLLASSTTNLPAQQGALATVPIRARVPAGSTLVVEIVAPDMSASGWFFAGSNGAGETAPSYLVAPGCNLNEPTTFTSLGFRNVGLVMAVTGGTTVDCARPAWLEVTPSSGTIVPGASQSLNVRFDAAGLNAGRHSANLCIASNDPVPLLTVVPVSLTVAAGQTGLTISPEEISFGHIPAGISVGPATITLTNTSADSIGVTVLAAAAAPFARSGGNCPAPPFQLAASASCTLAYTFMPIRAEAASQSLVVASSVGTRTISLVGTGIAVIPASMTLLGGSGQTTTVGTPFAASLAVQVRDAWNNPVAGIDVNFSAPISGASAVLTSGTARTDANGYASIRATANGLVGSYIVSAGAGFSPPVTFALTNRVASADVGVRIVADRGHVQSGRLLNYMVSVHNAGPDAAIGATVNSALSPLLDAGALSWLCIGPQESGCTAAGQGGFSDANLRIPAGGSAAYLITAPVRRDAGDGLIETSVTVSAAGDPNPGNDRVSVITPIVLYRDGFESYGDGASVLPLEPLATPFAAGDSLTLILPEPSGALIESLVTALAADGTGAAFRLERFNGGDSSRVRLVVVDADGSERAGAWLSFAFGAELTVALDDDITNSESGEPIGNPVLLLIGAGNDVGLPLLSRPSVYRLSSAVPLRVHRATE
jgi:hypothetical protein